MRISDCALVVSETETKTTTHSRYSNYYDTTLYTAAVQWKRFCMLRWYLLPLFLFFSVIYCSSSIATITFSESVSAPLMWK